MLPHRQRFGTLYLDNDLALCTAILLHSFGARAPALITGRSGTHLTPLFFVADRSARRFFSNLSDLFLKTFFNLSNIKTFSICPTSRHFRFVRLQDVSEFVRVLVHSTFHSSHPRLKTPSQNSVAELDPSQDFEPDSTAFDAVTDIFSSQPRIQLQLLVNRLSI